MKNKFQRRIYGNVGEFWADMVWPLHNRKQLRQTMRGGLVTYAFRERLMMAVTAVNQCRYCSYFHAQQSLKAGLPPEEIRQLLDGNISQAPAVELPALLYAQHWAESGGRPDPAARQHLLDTYGREQATAIETILHMIRSGNLMGNTTDWLLYKLSFGRLGLTEADRTPVVDK